MRVQNQRRKQWNREDKTHFLISINDCLCFCVFSTLIAYRLIAFPILTHHPFICERNRPTDHLIALTECKQMTLLQTMVTSKPGFIHLLGLAQLQNYYQSIRWRISIEFYHFFYFMNRSSWIIKTTYSCNQIHNLFALLPEELFLWIKSCNIITFRGCNLSLAFLNYL